MSRSQTRRTFIPELYTGVALLSFCYFCASAQDQCLEVCNPLRIAIGLFTSSQFHCCSRTVHQRRPRCRRKALCPAPPGSREISDRYSQA